MKGKSTEDSDKSNAASYFDESGYEFLAAPFGKVGGDNTEQGVVYIACSHLYDGHGCGHRSVDAQRCIIGEKGENLAGYRGGGIASDGGRNDGETRDKEKLDLAFADAELDRAELSRSRHIVENANQTGDEYHRANGKFKIFGEGEDSAEAPEAEKTLGDHGLADVVHTPVQLVGSVKHLDDARREAVQSKEDNGGKGARATGDGGIHNEGHQGDGGGDESEGKIFACGVLPLHIRYLIYIHTVHRNGGEDIVDGKAE